MATSPHPSRRADHVRNRATLIAAAREVFAEQGPDAPIEDVVRRAGFAKGTFFRHFATKETLVQALLADRLSSLADIAVAINDEHPPGWETLRRLMECFLDHVAGDRSIAEFQERGERITPDEEIIAAKHRLDDQIQRTITDAQSTGEVRSDVVATDMPPIIFTIVRATARFHGAHPGLDKRYLRIFLDGLRAGETSDLGVSPLRRDELPPKPGACSRRPG